MNSIGILINVIISIFSVNIINDVFVVKVYIDDFFFLEIVFFVLLGFFCFFVLVFIVNCVLMVVRVNGRF